MPDDIRNYLSDLDGFYQTTKELYSQGALDDKEYRKRLKFVNKAIEDMGSVQEVQSRTNLGEQAQQTVDYLRESPTRQTDPIAYGPMVQEKTEPIRTEAFNLGVKDPSVLSGFQKEVGSRGGEEYKRLQAEYDKYSNMPPGSVGPEADVPGFLSDLESRMREIDPAKSDKYFSKKGPLAKAQDMGKLADRLDRIQLKLSGEDIDPAVEAALMQEQDAIIQHIESQIPPPVEEPGFVDKALEMLSPSEAEGAEIPMNIMGVPVELAASENLENSIVQPEPVDEWAQARAAVEQQRPDLLETYDYFASEAQKRGESPASVMHQFPIEGVDIAESEPIIDPLTAGIVGTVMGGPAVGLVAAGADILIGQTAEEIAGDGGYGLALAVGLGLLTGGTEAKIANKLSSKAGMLLDGAVSTIGKKVKAGKLTQTEAVDEFKGLANKILNESEPAVPPPGKFPISAQVDEQTVQEMESVAQRTMANKLNIVPPEVAKTIETELPTAKLVDSVTADNTINFHASKADPTAMSKIDELWNQHINSDQIVKSLRDGENTPEDIIENFKLQNKELFEKVPQQPSTNISSKILKTEKSLPENLDPALAHLYTFGFHKDLLRQLLPDNIKANVENGLNAFDRVVMPSITKSNTEEAQILQRVVRIAKGMISPSADPDLHPHKLLAEIETLAKQAKGNKIIRAVDLGAYTKGMEKYGPGGRLIHDIVMDLSKGNTRNIAARLKAIRGTGTEYLYSGPTAEAVNKSLNRALQDFTAISKKVLGIGKMAGKMPRGEEAAITLLPKAKAVLRNAHLADRPGLGPGKLSLVDPEGVTQTVRQNQLAIGRPSPSMPVTALEMQLAQSANELPIPMTTGLRNNFKNPTYVFDQMGYGIKDMVYGGYKRGVHNANVEIARRLDAMEGVAKTLPKESGKRIGTIGLAKSEDGLWDLIASGVDTSKLPELTPAERQTMHLIEEEFTRFLNRLNESRVLSGQQPIVGVDNYWPLIHKFTKIMDDGVDLTKAPLSNFIHPKGTPFGHAIQRTGAIGEIELDAFKMYKSYVNSATRHIHVSPVKAKIDAILNNPVDADGATMAITHPNTASYLRDWADFVTNPQSRELNDFVFRNLGPKWATRLKFLNRNVAFSSLAFGMRSAIIQPSALRNTAAVVGLKNTAKGFAKAMANSGEFDRAMRESDVLFGRNFDVMINDAAKQFRNLEAIAGKNLSKGKKGEALRRLIDARDKTAQLGLKYMLQALDMKTAAGTWLAAEEHAIKALKYDPVTARKFADEIVIKTQASADPGDIAPIQRTLTGKTLTMFQTFVINDMNFLAKEVLGVGATKPVSKADRLKTILKYIGATAAFSTLYEDVMGLSSPFPTPIRSYRESRERGDSPKEATQKGLGELTDILPIVSSARFGGGFGGASLDTVWNTTQKAVGRPVNKSWAELGGQLAGVPGTRQIAKGFRAKERGGDDLDILLGRYVPKKKRRKRRKRGQ